MTITQLMDLLCQFPGDTPVVAVPNYEDGERKAYPARNVVQIVDEDGQPLLLGITSDLAEPASIETYSRGALIDTQA